LVPREDPMALADALARLIVDDDLARRLGQAGRERVVAHYSRDAMRQRFETFYQRLVA
jgi:glycosyltransferase involved in cell wall biosynthesis